jgi:hypothetical protein
MENYGGIISTGETPNSSTRALCKSYQKSSSRKAGGNGKENEFVLKKYIFYIS